MKCVHGRDVGGLYGGECWECEQDKRRHREIIETIEQSGWPGDEETSAPPSRLGMDYGDYVCPHCRYKTLRRGASRCPACRGDPGRDFWAQISASEIETRRRQKEAAEQSQLHRAAEDAKWGPLGCSIMVFVLLAFGLFCYWVAHQAASGSTPALQKSPRPASTPTQGGRFDPASQPDRVPFLGNGEAPEVAVATTFSLMPQTVTGCLKVPKGFTHFDIDGLPPVPIRIFIQCTDSTNGVAVTRYSPVQPSSVRLENQSATEVGFIKVSPK